MKKITAKEIIHDESPEVHILYEEADLRIHTISRLVSPESIEQGELKFISLPVYMGVGIEQRSGFGNSYIVISFVKKDEEGNLIVEPVASTEPNEDPYNRVLDYLALKDGNEEIYNRVLEKAKEIVGGAKREV